MLLFKSDLFCMAHLSRPLALFLNPFGRERYLKGNSGGPKGVPLAPGRMGKDDCTCSTSSSLQSAPLLSRGRPGPPERAQRRPKSPPRAPSKKASGQNKAGRGVQQNMNVERTSSPLSERSDTKSL